MSELFEFTNNTIEKQVSDYYNYYLLLFTQSINYINDVEIKLLRFPDIDGYDRPYFHMITMKYQEKTCVCPRISIVCERTFSFNPLLEQRYLLKYEQPREICPNRMIALPVLEDFFNNKLLIWEQIMSVNGKGSKIRINCYDSKNRYLIVLDKRKNGDIFFKTSFPIEHDFKHNKLIEQYNKYQNMAEHIEFTSQTIRK